MVAYLYNFGQRLSGKAGDVIITLRRLRGQATYKYNSLPLEPTFPRVGLAFVLAFGVISDKCVN